MANIHTSRRSGLVLRGGRNVRQTTWIGAAWARSTIAAADTAVLSATGGTAITAITPLTIIRVRGFMALSSDQIVNTEAQELSMGMAVVTEQAIAIGVTAVPTPEVDRGSDAWFVYESISNQMFVSSAIGVLGPATVFRTYDSKAMRKVDNGFDLVQTIETGPNSAGAIFTDHFRVLVKLH